MTLLFGGSFDPVHLGHLDIARQAAEFLGAEKVFFLPAKKNPLKPEAAQASEADRLQMLQLALAEVGDRRFAVLDWELEREGPSYTLFTVEQAIREGMADPVLLMGDEVFLSLPKWHRPDRLLGLASFVVATRTAEHFGPENWEEVFTEVVRNCKGPAQAREQTDSEKLLLENGKWIAPLFMRALSASSSSIRKGHDWETQLPRSVLKFIKAKGLYTDRN